MNEEKGNILSFDDALNAINNATESFKIDSWVPSKSKYISFKEIDAKQQKNLLSAAMDNSVYSSEFAKCFYDILKNNILNEDSSIIDELTIFDRSVIALSLRNQISNTFNLKFNDEITEEVGLNDILVKVKNYKTPETKSLQLKNITATLSIPSLKNEISYEESFSKEKKINEIKTTKDLQSIVSEAFIGEITKYVNSIQIDDQSVISFDILTTNQKIRIVEKLPSGLIQKMLETISGWKNDFESYLKVKSSSGLEKVITVDSVLFLS